MNNSSDGISVDISLVFIGTFCILCAMFYSSRQFRNLHKRVTSMKQDNPINVWIDYSNYLNTITIINGSSFAAIELFNCNLNWCIKNDDNLFKMNFVSEMNYEYMIFKQKRLFSTVLIENIPLVALQVVYSFFVFNDLTSITTIAIIVSFLSILITTFEYYFYKSKIMTATPGGINMNTSINTGQSQDQTRQFQHLQMENLYSNENLAVMAAMAATDNNINNINSINDINMQLKTNTTNATDVIGSASLSNVVAGEQGGGEGGDSGEMGVNIVDGGQLPPRIENPQITAGEINKDAYEDDLLKGIRNGTIDNGNNINIDGEQERKKSRANVNMNAILGDDENDKDVNVDELYKE